MALSQKYLETIGDLLVFHKVIEKTTDLTEENFSDAIIDFQKKAQIFVDGIAGRETLWALQFPWVLQSPKLMWTKCDADVVKGIGGSRSTILREDVARRYIELRKEALTLGGVVTSDGGRRELTAAVSTGRSAKSLHYTGVAFDLAVESGFFNPDTDPYIVTRGRNKTYWVVWCRTTKGEEVELEAIYWKTWRSGVDLKKKVKGKFFNFTELCQKHGFNPIPPRAAFTRAQNRDYLSAEWWHFQADTLFISNVTQFGIELLKIDNYTPKYIQAENLSIWENRKAIFEVNHFV